jgi:pyruvate formate lyase activating enzyme
MKHLHEALLYSTSESGVCECQLCPRNCLTKPAKDLDSLTRENIGFCGTRINFSGKLYAVNFGRITSLSADPVEKKPLYHFLPGQNLLSFGSFGCNLRCPNCHNWEISQTATLIHNRPAVVKSLTDSFPEISPGEVVSQAVENNCPGIAYTYNEPTVFLEFALEVMQLARKAHLKNVWVSNGFFSAGTWEKIAEQVDAFNIDLKSFDPHFYQAHCKAALAPVIENLKRINKAGIHLEITTLIIPGLNDKEEVLEGLAEFIAQQLSPTTPWHLIEFTASISWQMQEWRSAGKSELETAFKIGKKAGLKFVYANQLANGANTYCPHCGGLNIRRLGYIIERYDDAGTCQKCGQKLNIIG